MHTLPTTSTPYRGHKVRSGAPSLRILLTGMSYMHTLPTTSTPYRGHKVRSGAPSLRILLTVMSYLHTLPTTSTPYRGHKVRSGAPSLTLQHSTHYLYTMVHRPSPLTHVHTHMYTHTHMHMYTHTHTHTHTHTQVPEVSWYSRVRVSSPDCTFHSAIRDATRGPSHQQYTVLLTLTLTLALRPTHCFINGILLPDILHMLEGSAESECSNPLSACC